MSSSLRSSQSTSNSIYSGGVAQSLADQTASDILRLIEQLHKDNKILRMENLVLENFLRKNDPLAIENMEEMVNPQSKLDKRTDSRTSRTLSSRTRLSDKSVSSRPSQRASITSRSGRIPFTIKINIPTRIEMAQHNIEDSDFELETFMQGFEIKRNYIKAIREEIAIRLHEIKESREMLEDIVEMAASTVSGRLSSEKLLRFMQEWVRKSDGLLSKLRLRKSHLLVLYGRVKANLAQKEELGETVHPVDFDQIKIENSTLINEINMKTNQLLEVKKIAAQSALVLNMQRKYLFQQTIEYKNLQEIQSQRRNQINELQSDIVLVETERIKALNKLNRMKEFCENFQVPDVLYYVHKLIDLKDLRKKLKIGNRQRKILQIDLSSAKTRMKRLTGSVKPTNISPTTRNNSVDVMDDIVYNIAKYEKLTQQELNDCHY